MDEIDLCKSTPQSTKHKWNTDSFKLGMDEQFSTDD